MSNFTIAIIACMTGPAFGPFNSRGKAFGTICQEGPNWSFSQLNSTVPYRKRDASRASVSIPAQSLASILSLGATHEPPTQRMFFSAR